MAHPGQNISTSMMDWFDNAERKTSAPQQAVSSATSTVQNTNLSNRLFPNSFLAFPTVQKAPLPFWQIAWSKLANAHAL
jgi:hypothetical protein